LTDSSDGINGLKKINRKSGDNVNLQHKSYINKSLNIVMGYKRIYREAVEKAMMKNRTTEGAPLGEEDIAHLPLPVQKYLRYAGTLGKPKVSNVFIAAKGTMRSNPGDSSMKFRSEQFNFYPDPVRLFYIRALKAGIPATGLHVYKDETASMQIKVAGLFRVVNAVGPEMNQGETVTVFNDMCCMAPATLISKNIQWEAADGLQVNARFTNGGITISATLFFDTEGRLIDFISYDRFETQNGKKYINNPWRTPVLEYGDFVGFRLPSKADVIYIRPEGEFCYGKFELLEIRYNQGKFFTIQ
jgi:hypothetical protein